MVAKIHLKRYVFDLTIADGLCDRVFSVTGIFGFQKPNAGGACLRLGIHRLHGK